MKRKILVFSCLICTLVFSSVSFASKTYLDIENHWAVESIVKMTETGVFQGYPEGTFQPEKEVTYGEFLKMITMAKGRELEIAVAPDHWAKHYYDKGFKENWFTSEDFTYQMLNDPMKREHMAMVISRVLGKIDTSQELDFIDISEKDPYYDDILKVSGTQILSGYPDGTFRPDQFILRGEGAVVIDLFLQYCNEKEGRSFYNITALSAESNSTDLLQDIVYNMEDFSYGIGLYDHILYYEILEEVPYQFCEFSGVFGGKSIEIDHYDSDRKAFLIKDNQIIWDASASGNINGEGIQRYYHEDWRTFPNFDYIAFVSKDQKADTMMLIQNPFTKEGLT